jgi:hypothetical protein
MHTSIRWTVAAMLCLAVTSSAGAQQRNSENTLRLKKGAPRPQAEITDVAWLSGYWRGSGLGGQLEEMWSQPAHDRMHGLFTLATDGKPVFSEAMLLVEEEGSLVLKVKHFTPEFVAWEEKEKSIRFPLVRLENGTAYFHGLTLRRNGDSLVIHIVLTHQGEKTEHELRLKRVPM